MPQLHLLPPAHPWTPCLEASLRKEGGQLGVPYL